MTQEGNRRLAAVWFADIVGYTDLSARDEDLALRVVRELQRVARIQCEARGGRVVKQLGDAVLAAFDSVDGAVRAAVAARDAFLNSTEALAAGTSLRVGLHLGEVTEGHDGDVYGDAVNAASRIQTVAEAGQVLISDVAFQLLQQRSTFEVESLGEHELKGIPNPVRLHAVKLIAEEDLFDVKELLQEEIAPLQLLDVEGFGGQGEIYLARDPSLRRTLAVKVLRSELLGDKQARSRFIREAQVIAGLSHPNVISIHSVGELKDGTPYFVMDYVEGGSLADRIHEEGPLSVSEARRILGQVASALKAAHDRGIVHRDIKASNVLYDADTGRALVTDWGIAALDASLQMAPEDRLTRTGVIIGSPEYMSPEQLAGDELGPETDVYSFGLFAFELLTGHGPFPAKTPRELMIAHLREDAPSLSGLRKDVDEEIVALVGRCLSKTPSERPTSHELTQRLAVGGDAVLEWPPPGLDGIQAAAKRLVRSIAACSLFFALALALSALFANAAPTQAVIFTPVAFACVFFGFLGVLAAAFFSGSLVRRGLKGRRLGYGWGTLLDVAADSRGDSGRLLAGISEYAGLTEAARLSFLRGRRASFFLRLAAVAVPVPALVILVVAGVTEASVRYVVYALIPTVLLLAVAVLLWNRELRAFSRARKRRRRRGGAAENLSGLVEPWHENLGLVSVQRDRITRISPMDGVSVGTMGLLILLVAGGVLVLLPIFFSGSLAPGLIANWAVPRVSATQERYLRAQVVKPWRLPADSSVSVQEASALVLAIGNDRGEEDPQGVVPVMDAPSWIDDILGEENPFGASYYTLYDSLLLMGSRGLTEAQLAWIAQTDELPILTSFGRVARAPDLDLFSARYPGALLDSVSWGNISLPRFGRLRTVSYWKLFRAAAFLSQDDAESAEEEIREILSVGVLLMDQRTILETLLGAVLATLAGDELLELYRLTGREAEIAGTRGEFAALDRPTEAGDVDPRSLFNQAAGTIRDETLAPGIRFEILMSYSAYYSCAGVNAVLFGPPEEWLRTVEEAREELVKRPGDRKYFRLADEWAPRMRFWYEPQGPSGRSIYALSRLSGWVFGTDRIPGCTLLSLAMLGFR